MSVRIEKNIEDTKKVENYWSLNVYCTHNKE